MGGEWGETQTTEPHGKSCCMVWTKGGVCPNTQSKFFVNVVIAGSKVTRAGEREKGRKGGRGLT